MCSIFLKYSQNQGRVVKPPYFWYPKFRGWLPPRQPPNLAPLLISSIIMEYAKQTYHHSFIIFNQFVLALFKNGLMVLSTLFIHINITLIQQKFLLIWLSMTCIQLCDYPCQGSNSDYTSECPSYLIFLLLWF